MKNVSPSSTYSLRGSFTTRLVDCLLLIMILTSMWSSKSLRPARAFRVTFEIPQHSFSSLKVEQLKVSGELYKPYKGVRTKSAGDLEWRW